MAQDLFNMSIEMFRLQLYKIGSRTLVSLIKQIYELKWSQGQKWSQEKINDIERKETIIMAELNRRKELNKNNMHEYQEMINKINKMKRIF